MPSGLAALLDDVAAIAKLAAASIDDVGVAAGRAGVKAAGVVIDDTAVTPRYVTGFTPDRELPIIWRIAKGSLKNKLLFILPVALLLSALLPWAITPLLMIGGAYLCFEGAEKVSRSCATRRRPKAKLAEEVATLSAADHEEMMVAGAIRTDFILSAEIMAIALAEVAIERRAVPVGEICRPWSARPGLDRGGRDHDRRLRRGRPDREDGRCRPAPGEGGTAARRAIGPRPGPRHAEADGGARR